MVDYKKNEVPLNMFNFTFLDTTEHPRKTTASMVNTYFENLRHR